MENCSHSEDLGGTPVKKRKTSQSNLNGSELGLIAADNGGVMQGDVVDLPENISTPSQVTSKCPNEDQNLLANPETRDDLSSSSSSASESDWQPSSNGAFSWMYEQMQAGKNPRDLLHELVPSMQSLPDDLDSWTIWKLIIRLISEPPRRQKLPNVNTFLDAVNLIKSCKRILVLTGAGVSVSCGIPDFRSRDGVYARLAVDFPDLPSPESMFDISYFRQDPRPFFKFAKEIYPGQFKPSLIHRFIAMLDKSDKLLRNYTQNIDTLEQVAGIRNVIQCHGSFATATCQLCKFQTNCEAIREDIFQQVIPHCPRCPAEEPGILKPDIVFFGENLPEHFHRQMTVDKDEADLLVVIGSALKVRPVALIPSSLPASVPQILINRESLPHMSFDVELLGDGDTVVSEMCRHLGAPFAALVDQETTRLKEITTLPDDTSSSPNKNDGKKVDVASRERDVPSRDKNDPRDLNNDVTKMAVDSPLQGVLVIPPNSESLPSHRITNGEVTHNSELSGCENRNDVHGITSSQTGECKNENENYLKIINDVVADQNDRETSIKLSSNRDENRSHDTSNIRESDLLAGSETNECDRFDEKAVGELPKCLNHDAVTNSHDQYTSRENAEKSNEKTELTAKSSPLAERPCNSQGEAQREPHERASDGAMHHEAHLNGKVMDEEDYSHAMGDLWKSRWKQSISKRLPAGCFYFDGKRRCIFPGAEVPPEEVSDSSEDEEDDARDDDSSDDSASDSLTGISPLQRHPSPRPVVMTSRESRSPEARQSLASNNTEPS